MSRGVERVSSFLRERGIEARVVTLDDSTKTSQMAADALGCTVAEIAKSIVFRGGDTALVVVISGDRRVDTVKLSEAFGGGVSKADADWVRKRTGYVIGGVPPFPHGEGVEVFLDSSLRRFEKVWAAAGDPNSVMHISAAEIEWVLGSKPVDVAQ
jgi:prolyl-tRNA editing enzyme YbaK/EbsC (Cys-tRNA(Pro) deacylase)